MRLMSDGIVKPIPLEEEYAKDTGISEKDIQQLREWLHTQPHMPNEITDLDLILAYHCCHKSSEVAKQLIDLHFTSKTIFRIFENRVIDDKILLAANTAVGIPLQTRAHDQSALLYCRVIDTNVKNFIFADIVKAILMMLDIWQCEEGTWPGLQILVDMNGISLSHITRLDVSTLQEYFFYLQEAVLLNLKGIHFLNVPSFMDRVMMVLKPFLKKELMEMIEMHQVGSTSLEKYVSMKALPKEAGGEWISLNEAREKFAAKLKTNKEYFAEEAKKRVTESKRPGKPKNRTDFFGGIEGSFKKLDID